jgi:hypothetical protein
MDAPPRNDDDHFRSLSLAARTFFQARETLVSRSHALAVAHVHVRGNRIAAASSVLVAGADLLRSERDPDRAAALAVLQFHRAAALGHVIDDFLDDCEFGELRSLFAPLADLRARRDPASVARAAAVLLARITEVLTYPVTRSGLPRHSRS